MLKALLKNLVSRQRGGPAATSLVLDAQRHIAQHAWAEADRLLTQALAIEPASALALRLRGRVSYEQRQFARAESDYAASLAVEPDDLDTALDAARLMYELNRFDDSLDFCESTRKAHPASSRANHWRGLMLRELGRYDEAEAALRSARVSDPDSTDVACGVALVLADLGRHSEAEAELRGVLASNAEHQVARWQLAILLLGQGRFSEGWACYETRLLRSDTYVRPRALPFWDGTSPLDGPLLVLAEQALGDELLFASCLPDLMLRVGKVIVECDPRLSALYTRSFPQAAIFAQRDPRAATAVLPVNPAPVAQIAAGSLPALFRSEVKAFPARSGYLHADGQKVQCWRDTLRALGTGPKIGLSWRGGTAKTRRALRSLMPRDLCPLFRRGDVNFVSLQYGDVEHDLSSYAALGQAVHHWPEAMVDYEETAALVTALDLVVTVQTAVAHLAGALGRPVFILVPASPEWRYLVSGSQLPWYPSATLFRQARVGDWAPVVEAVASAIDQRFSPGGRGAATC